MEEQSNPQQCEISLELEQKLNDIKDRCMPPSRMWHKGAETKRKFTHTKEFLSHDNQLSVRALMLCIDSLKNKTKK